MATHWQADSHLIGVSIQSSFHLYVHFITHSNTDHEARFNSVKWYRYEIHKGETGLTFVLFSGDNYFQVNEYGSSQSNNFPTLILAVSLLGIKVKYCVLIVKLGLLSTVLSETINSH